MDRSEELREDLLLLYAAMSSGSRPHIESFLSSRQGGVFIGVEHSQFWKDARAHLQDITDFLAGLRIVEWQAGDVFAYAAGDLGWTADHPTVTVLGAVSIELRLTLVWLREDEVWRIVHGHASFGAP